MVNQASRPAETAAESDRIGFFGKVPSHGDFISDGLERELISTFDDWMRSGLHACADMFAGRWPAIFSSSPPIRFIVERGIWGNCAYVGVLLPSTDRVGGNIRWPSSPSLTISGNTQERSIWTIPGSWRPRPWPRHPRPAISRLHASTLRSGNCGCPNPGGG